MARSLSQAAFLVGMPDFGHAWVAGAGGADACTLQCHGSRIEFQLAGSSHDGVRDERDRVWRSSWGRQSAWCEAKDSCEGARRVVE